MWLLNSAQCTVEPLEKQKHIKIIFLTKLKCIVTEILMLDAKCLEI